MMRNRRGHPFFGFGAAVLTAFCFTDCATGTTNSQQSTIIYKYIDQTLRCDENGNCRTDTDYVVVFDCNGRVHRWDAPLWTWAKLHPEQTVTMAHRDGRWTAHHYLHWITKAGGGSW